MGLTPVNSEVEFVRVSVRWEAASGTKRAPPQARAAKGTVQQGPLLLLDLDGSGLFVPLRRAGADGGMEHYELTLCWPLPQLLLVCEEDGAFSELVWQIEAHGSTVRSRRIAAGAIGPERALDLLAAADPFSV